MEICKPEKCTGCYACVNSCKHGCIKMTENELGALLPIIDEDSCIHCGACIKSCPNNIKLEFYNPIGCHAAWIKNKEKRRICASGGIASIFSEYIIKQSGIFYGSCYDNELIPSIKVAKSLEDIEKFKGSRYVQSIVGNQTFIDVKKNLISGIKVLYFGTPCQIAGLKAFLKKDYDNLITVDLICHGVCPTKYFTEEISYLKKIKGIDTLTDVRFRGNDGNNFYLTLWNKNKMLYKKESYCQYYLAGFLLGVSLRENCYTCNYARPERVSDITIGDFIGLGKLDKFDYSTSNVSSVLINTLKGRQFYEDVCNSAPEIISFERQYKERLMYKPSLVYPYPRHKLNESFKLNYAKYGYVIGIRKTLKFRVLIAYVMKLINIWTYSYRIPRKIYRILTEKKA